MDEPHTDESLLRKASFTFWLLGALMLLVALLVGFLLFGPNPPIIISKATTHITTPLDANGLPDYAAVLLADSRKGVTPENNGAVPFLMALWPEESEENFADGYIVEDAKLLCAELGLPGVPPIELRVTPLQTDKNRLAVLRLLRERLPKPEGLSETAAEEIDPSDESLLGMVDMDWREADDNIFFGGTEADAIKDNRVVDFLLDCEPVGRPWTSEDLPFLAEWIEENETAFDLIVKGAERAEWHWPSPGLLHGGSGVLGASYSYNSLIQLRSAARLLSTRSHFRQGNGNYEEAARDALAILRLAHHFGMKGLTLSHQLVAGAIGEMGLALVNQIAADRNTPATTLHDLLQELNQLGPFSRFAYTVDKGDRFFILDQIANLGGDNDLHRTGPGDPVGLNLISYDWNPSLRAINQHFDAVVAASKLPTWSGRQAAYAQVTASMARAGLPPQTTREWMGLLTAQGRGQAMGNLWVNVFNSNAYNPAEDRVTTHRQLTRLGIALAIHRAEQGAYPETLDELVPGILQKLPVDLFHKNPFVYRKTDDGYLLYCYGANGKDDKGSNDGQQGWDGSKLEGVEVKEPEFDINNASDWDANGEYIGGSGIEEDADDPRAKIPAGADDLSLRLPLPAPEPWPWETAKKSPEGATL